MVAASVLEEEEASACLTRLQLQTTVLLDPGQRRQRSVQDLASRCAAGAIELRGPGSLPGAGPMPTGLRIVAKREALPSRKRSRSTSGTINENGDTAHDASSRVHVQLRAARTSHDDMQSECDLRCVTELESLARVWQRCGRGSATPSSSAASATGSRPGAFALCAKLFYVVSNSKLERIFF